RGLNSAGGVRCVSQMGFRRLSTRLRKSVQSESCHPADCRRVAIDQEGTRWHAEELKLRAAIEPEGREPPKYIFASTPLTRFVTPCTTRIEFHAGTCRLPTSSDHFYDGLGRSPVRYGVSISPGTIE